MHDRINDLLGWDDQTQLCLRALSKGDFSILFAVADPDRLRKEDDKSDPSPYRDLPDLVCMTSRGSANDRLYRVLEAKGWMHETTADLDAQLREIGTVRFSWSEKGFRLMPQLLAKFAATGHRPPDEKPVHT